MQLAEDIRAEILNYPNNLEETILFAMLLEGKNKQERKSNANLLK